MTFVLPDDSVRISIDRGGTFTDVHASWPLEDGTNKETIIKLLSVDPANYPDAPTEGVRRILEICTGTSIPRGVKIDTSKIKTLRLSTTVATNALLERQGAKHSFVVTKGFKDLLRIANQSRPDIFSLNPKRPGVLYENIIEVDERVTLLNYSYDPKPLSLEDYKEQCKTTNTSPDDVVQGVSGELIQVLKKPDVNKIRKDLQTVYDSGIRCLAICLLHSYTFFDHEKVIAQVAKEIGFEHISVSHQLTPQIKAVSRAFSTTADAYLTPVLKDYLNSVFKGFDDKLLGDATHKSKVEFMTSEGSLVSNENFSGLQSILSGPAGGVVGYSLTSWDENYKKPIIGFDMGGTSTDVSRFDGHYEKVYETTTAGITIQSAQLDINTVAAGGGSCLTFKNGLFNVGPRSAGANPGPACYRKGGPLAITDANLVLGRLLPDYFPKIFGKTEDMPLDVEASRSAFEQLRQQINSHVKENGNPNAKELSLDEVAYGFIKIANEAMASPIRSLTEAKGYATSKHILASFGGAGGQHACELARSLAISQILIHRYSSILSAYGMALSDRAVQLQEPCVTKYNAETKDTLVGKLKSLEERVIKQLSDEGFSNDRIQTECYLNMRYEGSDTLLMTLAPSDGSFDFQKVFEERYMMEFGFLLESKSILVDDIRVRGIGKTFDSLGKTTLEEVSKTDFKLVDIDSKAESKRASVYFAINGRQQVPVFLLENLGSGILIPGPAMIVDGTQTLVIDEKAKAKICTSAVFIELE